MRNFKLKLWALFHTRKISRFVEQCQVGTILEHSHGDTREIVSRGDKGCLVKTKSAPMVTSGFVGLILGAADRTLSLDWNFAAYEFKVARSPCEALEEVLRARQ